MPNLPDLTRSLITRKKKVSPFCHFEVKIDLVGNAGASSALVQRIRRGFFLAFRRVSVKKKSLFYSSRNAWFGDFFFSYFECSFYLS